MKTKTFKTKLSLNKKTIANLEKNELNNFKGGTRYSHDLCNTT
jgi:natural product precursor